jgi:tRNA dimethylallyltransferase
MSTLRPIVLILGPTAGGKTRLAIDLARHLTGGGECICADSMQVYRGMDIGTAKPTPAERAEAPHHLLDLVEPDNDGFSVDSWLELAERTIDDIRRHDRWPIVVGGTNLYIQALLYGLFEGPEPDMQLRGELQALSTSDLRQRLLTVDPAAAARIHPNDRKRSIRAIEVYEACGERLSDLQQQWSPDQVRSDVRVIGLDWPVEAINRRINARVRQMIADDLVEEVRRLWEQRKLGVQAREALGYKQIIDHLEGRCTLDDAVEQIKIRTRRFAKQQRTWLRRFRSLPCSSWLDAAGYSSQNLAKQVLKVVGDADVDRQPTRNNPQSG